MDEKLYKLRLELEKWEKNININKLTEKSRIIYSYLLANKSKLPISIKEMKDNNLIKDNMSTASFNRSINELIKELLIKTDSNPSDRRASRIIKIKN